MAAEVDVDWAWSAGQTALKYARPAKQVLSTLTGCPTEDLSKTDIVKRTISTSSRVVVC